MNNKSKTVGYLLAFFLGGIGAHAFYYRKYVKGSLYLVFCWTFIPVFLGWIDMFFIKSWQKKIEASTSFTPINNQNNKLDQTEENILEIKVLENKSIAENSIIRGTMQDIVDSGKQIKLPERIIGTKKREPKRVEYLLGENKEKDTKTLIIQGLNELLVNVKHENVSPYPIKDINYEQTITNKHTKISIDTVPKEIQDLIQSLKQMKISKEALLYVNNVNNDKVYEEMNVDPEHTNEILNLLSVLKKITISKVSHELENERIITTLELANKKKEAVAEMAAQKRTKEKPGIDRKILPNEFKEPVTWSLSLFEKIKSTAFEGSLDLGVAILDEIEKVEVYLLLVDEFIIIETTENKIKRFNIYEDYKISYIKKEKRLIISRENEEIKLIVPYRYFLEIDRFEKYFEACIKKRVEIKKKVASSKDEAIPKEEQMQDEAIPKEEQMQDETIRKEKQMQDEAIQIEEQTQAKAIQIEEQTQAESVQIEEQTQAEAIQVKDQPQDEAIQMEEEPQDEAIQIEEDTQDEAIQIEEEPQVEAIKIEELTQDKTIKIEEQMQNETIQTVEQAKEDGWKDGVECVRYSDKKNLTPIENISLNVGQVKQTKPIKSLFGLKHKISKKIKELPEIIDTNPSKAFYDEQSIILPKYSHIKTPSEILKEIQEIRHSSKRGRSVEREFFGGGFSWSGQNFIKDSLDYASKKGVKSSKVPLHAYWTTFDKLDSKQKQWYFYWREQVLNGKYPDVDLSYIILFAYELLNYSFNQNASFNISMMVRLHDNYLNRFPKVRTYIGYWTGDMLIELGEHELSKDWVTNDEYLPPLFKQLKDKHNDLARISITTWKPYVESYNETVFFKSYKNKIYKTFKESIPLLQKVYQKQGQGIIDRYFNLQDVSKVEHLFSSAVIGRNVEPIQVRTKKVLPTEYLTNEVTALFRLSENITRLLNGEKRQIKVEESFLPEGFREIMMEHFNSIEREKTKRFRVVQKADNIEDYGNIPPPPEENHVPEQKPIIEFNSDNIKSFRAETEELIAIFNDRSTEEDNVPGFTTKGDTSPNGRNSGIKHETMNARMDTEEVDSHHTEHPSIGEAHTKIETVPPIGTSYSSTDIFFTLGGGGIIDGEEDFIESLTAMEKEFLVQFEKGVYNRKTANSFLKKKGIMLGTFISKINEKSNEYLGDNFIEFQDEEITIYKEYEQCINMLKGTE